MTSFYSVQNFTASNVGQTIKELEKALFTNMSRYKWRKLHSSRTPRGHAYLLSELGIRNEGSILSVENQQRLAILRSGAEVVSRTVWLWL